MHLAAVIFDVYQTLIQVGPAPSDAETRWTRLCHVAFGHPPELTLAEFKDQCEAVVARHHATAQEAGVQHPEVFWPDVAAQVLPKIRALWPLHQAEFLYQQIQLLRSIHLMPGAALILRRLAQQPVLLGIASNAQPYTHRELASLLAPEQLRPELFDPELSFWSWQHGFSKPNPHAFRILAARLAARGVTPNRALMVGDRLDNDLLPARAQGWQTWQIRQDNQPADQPGGDWAALGRFLDLNLANAKP